MVCAANAFGESLQEYNTTGGTVQHALLAFALFVAPATLPRASMACLQFLHANHHRTTTSFCLSTNRLFLNICPRSHPFLCKTYPWR